MGTDDPTRDGPGDATAPVGERIRRRREELGMSARDLAERVGISPSYLSLIERQGRVPSADVATALAHELADDVELYLAWAQSKDFGDLADSVRQLDRLYWMSSDPETRSRIASGAALDDVVPGEPAAGVAARRARTSLLGSVRQRLERYRRASRKPSIDAKQARADEPFDAHSSEEVGGSSVRVALLPNGADPDKVSAPREVLDVDARLLPPGIRHCFAYRPDLRSLRRVLDLVHPGDLVILSPAEGRIDPNRIYAVRHRGQIVLTRAIFTEEKLAMLPSPREPRSFEWVRLDDASGTTEERLKRVIAGVVVATLRWWVG